MNRAPAELAACSAEILASLADSMETCHFLFVSDWSPRHIPSLAGLVEAADSIGKRWNPRRNIRSPLTLPSHFLRRKPRGRDHESASGTAVNLRIVGRLKHTPHIAPQGAGIAVTMHVAPLPSQRSVVGTPLVIQVSDCGCGTPNSSKKRQSGALGAKSISHSIAGWPPPCPQGIASVWMLILRHNAQQAPAGNRHSPNGVREDLEQARQFGHDEHRPERVSHGARCVRTKDAAA